MLVLITDPLENLTNSRIGKKDVVELASFQVRV